MDLEEKPKLKKIESIGLRETSKNKNVSRHSQLVSQMINKLRDNPSRLQQLKESLKYFLLLKKNNFLERKRNKASPDDILTCSCIPCPEEEIPNRPQGPNLSYNCGDKCLNKMTCTECDVDLCPCGEYCKNRRFQKHDDACVYPIRCGGKGWGLAAGEKIRKGQFIMQYIGEIFYINSPLGRRRIQDYSKSVCTYLMKINNQEVIDPTYKGNLARFINHSCDPNCITIKWNVLGEVCIGIFAYRDILEDEEFTFDYQFDSYNTPLTKCLCGTHTCKGYLGLKPTNKTQEEWEEHLENMLCKICQMKTPNDDDQLLLCDKCNCGFHMKCLTPPLDNVPKDSWFCQECLEDLRIEDENEKEKQQMESLAQKKMKAIVSEQSKKKKKQIESSSSESDQDYEEQYEQMKNLENEATLELLEVKEAEDLSIERDRIKKKKKKEEKEIEEKLVKRKQQLIEANTSSDQKTQLDYIINLANDKFLSLFQESVNLQQKINEISQKFNNHDHDHLVKKCVKVNIIEQRILKKNTINIFFKIGHRTSFQLINTDQVDYFKKDIDLTILGNQEQLDLFNETFQLIEIIVKELKKEMGIVEGQIKVPIIYLKRLIINFSKLENKYSTNILYNKQLALSEEIFHLDRVTPIKIKGSKQNIQNCVQAISEMIQILSVQRLYISKSETKTVQQNMGLVKCAEIRISRNSVYNSFYRGEQPQRDINHPFFYIQFREKEVCLIGTQEQISISSSAIRQLLEQEQNKKESDKEMTYFTMLVSPQHKDQCKQVKLIMEKESQSTKVLLFEASHPRKNMTILVLCLRSQVSKVRQEFIQMIQEHANIHIDNFQDQMMMQMCRYVFKYLQNTMMTQEMAFMKNWDLITPYFYNYSHYKNKENAENWFIKSCANQLQRDYETQLYIQYMLGPQIIANLNEYERQQRRKHLLTLIRKILIGLSGNKQQTQKFQEFTIQPQEIPQEIQSVILKPWPIPEELEVQPQQIQLGNVNEISSETTSSQTSNSKSLSLQSSDEEQLSPSNQEKRMNHYSQNYYSSRQLSPPKQRSLRHEKYERMEKEERYDRDRDRYERYDRIDRYDKYERQDKYDRPDKYERTDKYERADKYERPDKYERADKYERPDKYERVDRQDRQDKYERQDRNYRNEKIERDVVERIERPEIVQKRYYKKHKHSSHYRSPSYSPYNESNMYHHHRRRRRDSLSSDRRRIKHKRSPSAEYYHYNPKHRHRHHNSSRRHDYRYYTRKSRSPLRHRYEHRSSKPVKQLPSPTGISTNYRKLKKRRSDSPNSFLKPRQKRSRSRLKKKTMNHL